VKRQHKLDDRRLGKFELRITFSKLNQKLQFKKTQTLITNAEITSVIWFHSSTTHIKNNRELFVFKRPGLSHKHRILEHSATPWRNARARNKKNEHIKSTNSSANLAQSRRTGTECHRVRYEGAEVFGSELIRWSSTLVFSSCLPRFVQPTRSRTFCNSFAQGGQ